MHFLLIRDFHVKDGVYGKIVSDSPPQIAVGFFCLFVFLMCLMCRSNLASFGIFFTENCFVCSCGFGVFKGQGKVRESSYITMLNCKLCDWYF